MYGRLDRFDIPGNVQPKQNVREVQFEAYPRTYRNVFAVDEIFERCQVKQTNTMPVGSIVKHISDLQNATHDYIDLSNFFNRFFLYVIH